VSQYQKGKTNLDFIEARDSEWQWHRMGHMQVCTSLQTDNYASNDHSVFFTGQMPFLLPNQQRQNTNTPSVNCKRITGLHSNAHHFSLLLHMQHGLSVGLQCEPCKNS